MLRIPRVRRLATYLTLAAATVGALAGAFCAGLVLGRGDHSERSSVVGQAAELIKSRGQNPSSTSELDAAAIRGMLSGLDDRWATYYGVGQGTASANSLQALLNGQYSGLGVWLRQQDSGRQIVIASVTAGSPAATAGLQVGDRIVAVDGHDVSQDDMETIGAALRGQAGTAVDISVTNASGQARDVHMVRVDLPATPVTTDDIAPGIVRIRIGTFTAGVGKQVAAAQKAALAAGARAIVLDLRGNPGGLLDEAVASASVFLNGGTVVTLQGRSVSKTALTASAGGDTHTPLAVLVDGGTASAAEVVAGALSDRGRAVLVGTKTFGKGSVQQTTTLSDGSVLELTVATYQTPNGRVVDRIGITPDVVVDSDAASAVAQTRAIAVLDALTGS
jgi:carboxyl-terminal processing protease